MGFVSSTCISLTAHVRAATDTMDIVHGDDLIIYTRCGVYVCACGWVGGVWCGVWCVVWCGVVWIEVGVCGRRVRACLKRKRAAPYISGVRSLFIIHYSLFIIKWMGRR